MIGTTEAFTRQPINQLDCNTVGISRAQGGGRQSPRGMPMTSRDAGSRSLTRG